MYEVNINDLLIALSGETVGKLGINKLNEKYYMNQRVGKIICKNLNQKYFYYWYIYNNVNDLVKNRAKGIA